jgi:hypothetical protein
MLEFFASLDVETEFRKVSHPPVLNTILLTRMTLHFSRTHAHAGIDHVTALEVLRQMRHGSTNERERPLQDNL